MRGRLQAGFREKFASKKSQEKRQTRSFSPDVVSSCDVWFSRAHLDPTRGASDVSRRRQRTWVPLDMVGLRNNQR